MRERRHRPARRPARGRPRDPAKTDAILAAATKLFLERGFSGASIEGVAELAGVSKITVYARFADKEILFQSMIRARCEAYNQPERFAVYQDLPPREALVEMGRNFLALLLDPEVLRLYRLISAEATQRPEVAELFFTAGPERTQELFRDYFRRAAARGVLAIDDPDRTTDDFLSLLRGKLHFRAQLNLRPRPRRSQIDAHVERVVELVLRLYG
jgi:TetR/AcrR family transcriptional repressor of mexJK operon